MQLNIDLKLQIMLSYFKFDLPCGWLDFFLEDKLKC
jgi:hypothetical protein